MRKTLVMMTFPRFILLGIILISVSACQQTSVPAELPTRFILPSATPTAPPVFTPAPTVTPPPPPTTAPTLNIASPTAVIAPTLAPRASNTPVIVSATPLPERFSFGLSGRGTALIARRIGTGSQVIMLVGGIHGGWEANTVDLIESLIGHFETTPGDILPGITLLFVPSLNPDGVALGRTVRGRFNANNVDLNRNWGCDWSDDAVFREMRVDPGDEPFSEPETRNLAALINDLRPAVVLFYHSAADGIFEGDCGGGGVSAEMAAVLGEATGYSYGAEFTSYTVTGTAASWVDSLGIPAADVELATSTDSEFERNLRGVMALQCWLSENRNYCQ